MDVLTSKSSQIYPREKLAHGVQHQMHFKSRYNSATKVFETKILNKQRIIFIPNFHFPKCDISASHWQHRLVKFRKLYKGKQFLSNYSETVCLTYNILLKLNLIRKINLPTQPCLRAHKCAMHVQPSCCSKSVPIATDSVRNPHEILKLIRIQNNQPPNPWVGFFHRI